MLTIPTALQRLAIIISYIVASLSICSWRPNSRPKRGPSRFFRAEFMKQSFAGSGRSSRLAMQFFSRELSARDSLVVWLIQLLPEGDPACCCIWASLIAAGGMVRMYVPIGVSMALRKYLSPARSKLSCACPL